MKVEVSKLFPVKCSDKFDACLSWLEIMKPYHGLTDTQMKVFAHFIIMRDQLLKEGNSEDIVNKILFHKTVKDEIMKRAGVKSSHFHIIIGSMRDKGVLNGKFLNNKFIPKFENNQMTVGFVFKYDD